MTPRERFVEFIKQEIGRPYRWGGNGPDAYDCSGLVCAALRYAGVHIGDHSAQDLYAMMYDRQMAKYTREGQIMYYGNPVTHVMVGIRYWGDGYGVLAGARGGNSRTISVGDAVRDRAYVATVMSDYWAHRLVAICDPWQD